jgi:DNA-binding response OmpR family regulator
MPKVLLLDTEPHLFSLLKHKLEREGFEVVTGSTATLPDLIIVDECHHLEFTSNCRTPVILLSHSDRDEHDLPHLKMPFRPNDLVELARKTVTI